MGDVGRVGATTRRGEVPRIRSSAIISCSRELFEEQGISKTSMKEVAERVGVSRGLIYHYFPDKETLVDAILDDYISDIIECLKTWDAGRIHGDVEGSLRSCLLLLRRCLFDRSALRNDPGLIENARLYNRFSDRIISSVVDAVMASTVPDYAAHYPILIDDLWETFYVLVTGLIGITRAHPEVSDEVLFRVAWQTLRLEEDSGASSVLGQSFTPGMRGR